MNRDDPAHQPFVPSPLIRALSRRFFDGIHVDPEWVAQVREAAERSTVVYVLRNQNVVDFLALTHLVQRHALPPIHFAHDPHPWWTDPVSGWLGLAPRRTRVPPAQALEETVAHGRSAVLFLKRPPGPLDLVGGASGSRGLEESSELTRALFAAQRRGPPKPIVLVPQVFVWTKRPDSRGRSLLDSALGPTDWPGTLRAVGQLLLNLQYVSLRAGEPLGLAEFLASAGEASEETLTRRLTFLILRRLERERLAIIGPARKAPERVRAEILRSPRLRETVEDLAGSPSEQYELTLKAQKMLEELMAAPDAVTLKGFDVALGRVFNLLYSGIEYDREGIERVRAASRRGTVVLLPSHKSHIDYLLTSFVFYRENIQLPHIAAGDNLDFFPVGALLRRGGAFFIRRSFRGDRLYAAVVDAYVRRLLRDGHPLEVFLEGQRSRTGKLLPPKLGLLSMIVDAALAVPQEIYFVPLSIGYERLVETESFERELQGGEKVAENAAGLLRSSAIFRRRYGRISLQFGELTNLRELAGSLGMERLDALAPAKRRSLVVKLASRVMDEINRVTAVTPGALAALVLLARREPVQRHSEVVDHARRLLGVLDRLGARVTPALRNPTGTLRPGAISDALALLAEAGSVELRDEAGRVQLLAPWSKSAVRGAQLDERRYSLPKNGRVRLDVTRNVILHFFVERALLVLALRHTAPTAAPLPVVRERWNELHRWLKHEFRLPPEGLDESFEATRATLTHEGVLASDGERLLPGAGSDGWSGLEWLDFYAELLRCYLEGYLAAAHALDGLLARPLGEKELMRRTLSTGRRLVANGELERPEAITRPIAENAIAAFIDRGFVKRVDGKLELSAERRSEAGVATLIAMLQEHLPGAR